MFSDEEGRLAVRLARETVEKVVNGEPIPMDPVGDKFEEKSGVFVTLSKHPEHDLRGCIGFPEPVYRLVDAIRRAARSAALEDPRFPPVRPAELPGLVVEVSLLTPPELVQVKEPKDLLKEIVVGRDGLILERGWSKGLLLPQVPIEWGWDVEEFLAHTCRKAGLPSNAWLDRSTRVFRFTANVFSEETPKGDVVRKELTSCD